MFVCCWAPRKVLLYKTKSTLWIHTSDMRRTLWFFQLRDCIRNCQTWPMKTKSIVRLGIYIWVFWLFDWNCVFRRNIHTDAVTNACITSQTLVPLCKRIEHAKDGKVSKQSTETHRFVPRNMEPRSFRMIYKCQVICCPAHSVKITLIGTLHRPLAIWSAWKTRKTPCRTPSLMVKLA